MSCAADYGDVWVCTDCYFAHHYGAHQEERPATDRETDDYLNGYATFDNARETDDGLVITEWFAGEDDSPCDREPLKYLEGFEIADNTCSNHYYDQKTENFDVDEVPCDQCGQTGWENGIEDFSWRSCDGCHSHLGGARYRLHLWKREAANVP